MKSVVARIGDGQGPIIAYKTVESFRLEFTTATRMPVVKTYGDGDVLVAGCVRIAPYIAGVNLRITLFSGGEIFENGQTQYRFSTSSMDQNHEYDYYFIKPAPGAVCHYIEVVE